MNEVEKRLDELRRELRGLSWRRRRRVLTEARDHLCCALEDGLSEAEAVNGLGRPSVVFMGFPTRRRRPRLAVVVAPVVLLALSPSLDGPLRLGAGTTPSQAAPSPGLTTRQQAAAVRSCVAAWNSEATGRWRAAAASAGIKRAHVSIIIEGTGPLNGSHLNDRLTGCTVSLQQALVASPYQHWIYVYAKASGRTFRFERLLRARTRTVAPATNARVDASGRLALSKQQIAEVCPVTPLGSRVEGVAALPGNRALLRGATTNLSVAQGHRLVVAIRNTGRTAIDGAIASIDITGPARPGRPWWRSGPRIIQRLNPGETVSVTFTPPALGHGVRLIRATTAAIACEARVADNSPVYRVKIA